MLKVNHHTIGDIPDEQIRFVVAAARCEGQWLYARHRERNTWDMPGGHRELGESCQQAMERELWEETGAEVFTLLPVCIYSVERNGVTSYGMLFFADVTCLGPLPDAFEMSEISFLQGMPKDLTYPDIQPVLFDWVQGWLNTQSNPEELWDLYDEERNLTGQLHRRGDPVPAGLYHLVVHVWMRNTEGKYLLTKRSPNKGFPNMWETTGGSALAGDNSLQAALREVREETGLTLDPNAGCCILSARKRDYIRDIWLFRQDFSLENVILQPGETTDSMYADAFEIIRLYENENLVPYDYLEELLAFS